MQELRIIIQVPWLAFGVCPDFMVCERRGEISLRKPVTVGEVGEKKIKTDSSLSV